MPIVFYIHNTRLKLTRMNCINHFSGTLLISLLSFLFTHNGVARDYNVNFQFKFDTQEVQLNKQVYSPSLADSLTVDLLKMYVSNIEITYADGSTHKVKKSNHLINLEDPQTAHIVLKDIPAGAITHLDLKIGTDSLTNVSGSMSGDLDPINGMYWAWRSGYVNFKLEGTSKKFATRKNRFTYHIGGYLSPHTTCRSLQSNVSTYQQENISFVLDLELLMKQAKDTASVMIPGPQASKLADILATSFSVN